MMVSAFADGEKDAGRPDPLLQFDDNPAIIYGLDSSLRLIYCNPAWDRFALENGGAHLLGAKMLGCSVIAVVPRPLKPFYSGLYSDVLTSGVPAERLYECSSDRNFRRFHMHVQRKHAPGRAPWLVVINSLVLEQPHAAPEVQPDNEQLRGKNGLITMCCHCRRTKMPGSRRDLWLWIPRLVREMPLEISHGICSICFYVHYQK